MTKGKMTDEIAPLIVRIAEAPGVEMVWSLATDYFRSMGFSRVNYGYTRFLHGSGIGNPADAMFLTTASPDYATRYFAGGLYARTPAFKWAHANTGACTWKWVREAMEAGTLTPDELAALRQNATMGVRAGITISFPEASARAKGAMGLIADPDLTEADVERLFVSRGTALQAVAQVMHLKLVQMPFSARKRALTTRQREVLEWVAGGKTAQDVATVMAISLAMVEKHLKLAREALDADTTAQAVAKATLLNLIFQPQPLADAAAV
ncbi:MAG: LuxR family transcriptional regulator [Rhodobacteraceae bacterium PARR1]|nr:MAG: LuxR family transcriptional regulator [Rhodobacteraceae bacterium PARR1]